MPLLCVAKIVQIECRISSLLEYYAEMQPIFCKDKKKNCYCPSFPRKSDDLYNFLELIKYLPFLGYFK